MSRELSEIEVLENEIERLEAEYYTIYDEYTALSIDDKDYDKKSSWYNIELNSLEVEIQNMREEIRWCQKG